MAQLVLILNLIAEETDDRKIQNTKCFWTTIKVVLMNKIQKEKNKHMHDDLHMLFERKKQQTEADINIHSDLRQLKKLKSPCLQFCCQSNL